jgi:endoglucanase
MRLATSSIGFISLALAVGIGCHNEPAPQSAAPAAGATPAPAAAAPPAEPNPGAGNSGVAQAGPPPGPATVPDKDCPADFVIDDAEDNNNQVKQAGGRNGYWYTYADKQGTTISPPAHTKFLMSQGGAKDSKYSAHMLGKISANGDPLFGGMGFSFTDPKGPYDASKYTGISFWAKVGPGSTKTLRLKVPDVNTDPDGKVCKECFNDFGADLTLTDQWKKYTLPFASLKQMKDWGDPNPASINKSKLYGMQWQVNDSGASYDIWIDEVQFTGCP